MKIRHIALAFAVGILVASASGCGTKVSQDQPLDQLKADADKYSDLKLNAMVEAYKAEIAKCQTLLGEVKGKISKLTPADLSGPEAKQLNSQAADISQSVGKLQERLQILLNEADERKHEAPASKTP